MPSNSNPRMTGGQILWLEAAHTNDHLAFADMPGYQSRKCLGKLVEYGFLRWLAGKQVWKITAAGKKRALANRALN